MNTYFDSIVQTTLQPEVKLTVVLLWTGTCFLLRKKHLATKPQTPV